MLAEIERHSNRKGERLGRNLYSLHGQPHEASDDQRCGYAKGAMHFAASLQSYMLRIVMTLNLVNV